jgi:alkanesulfonate monooxygenase SsuD/methylene tetrahydromethanopterin reductase-like flavin-dependent oxidoreductase (luciferase family)
LRDDFDIPVLRPVQRLGFGGWGPPLILGGTGDRILQLAAEQADIISVAGAFQIKGQPPGTMRIATAAEADERVRYARECAGDRADHIEWHALTQAVVQTDDRRGAAGQLAERLGQLMSPDEFLQTPFVFIGTIEQMAERVLDNRDRYSRDRSHPQRRANAASERIRCGLSATVVNSYPVTATPTPSRLVIPGAGRSLGW